MSAYCDLRNGKRQWRYRTVVRLPDGTTERIGGKPAINTKLEALAAERAHIARALREPATPIGKGNARQQPNPEEQPKEVLTFERFIDEIWWPTYPAGRGNRPTTIAEKSSHIRHHLKPAFGGLLLPDLTPQRVTQLFADSQPAATRARAGLRRPASSGVAVKKRSSGRHGSATANPGACATNRSATCARR